MENEFGRGSTVLVGVERWRRVAQHLVLVRLVLAASAVNTEEPQRPCQLIRPLVILSPSRLFQLLKVDLAPSRARLLALMPNPPVRLVLLDLFPPDRRRPRRRDEEIFAGRGDFEVRRCSGLRLLKVG